MTDAKKLKTDKRNHNKGTQRGAYQIEESIKRFGYGRSIVVDKNEITIAGNHLLAQAQENGSKVRIIESDGTELIVVKRTDLDLETDVKARGLALADNITARNNLDLDEAIVLEEAKAGVDLSWLMTEKELAALGAEPEVPAEEPAVVGEEAAPVVKLAFSPEEKAEWDKLLKKAKTGLTPEGTVLEALRRMVGGKR